MKKITWSLILGFFGLSIWKAFGMLTFVGLVITVLIFTVLGVMIACRLEGGSE